MNTEIDVIRKALESAPPCEGLDWKKTGASVTFEGATDFDATIKVVFCGKTVLFHVEVKQHLHRTAIERIIARKNDVPPKWKMMLVSEYVTSAQAEILQNNGVAFLDTAGNACMDLPGLHLFVAGKGKAPKQASHPARIFHRAGLQIIFAFLTDPALDKNPEDALLNMPFRDITSQTGVALGSIGTIIGNLLEQRYIVEDRNLRFLVNRQQLFEKWVASYVDRMRPKLIAKRYRSKGKKWWNGVQSLGAGNYWGGEVAAAKLTGYLRPERATLYSRGETQRLILDADLRLDPQGDVEMLNVFWEEWPYGGSKECVHPLLVYADLMASENDRNLETAKRVYEQYLRDIIAPRG